MRKTLMASVLVATMGLSGLAGTALAVSAQASTSVQASTQPSNTSSAVFDVNTQGGAPVKSGPGKKYDTIDWLPFGTEITGQAIGNWVRLDGGGYVYLGRLQDPSGVITTPTRAYSAYVSDPAGAPVRSGPGRDYPVVNRLDFGDKVIGKPQGKWLKTQDGYVLRAKLSA